MPRSPIPSDYDSRMRAMDVKFQLGSGVQNAIETYRHQQMDRPHCIEMDIFMETTRQLSSYMGFSERAPAYYDYEAAKDRSTAYMFGSIAALMVGMDGPEAVHSGVVFSPNIYPADFDPQDFKTQLEIADSMGKHSIIFDSNTVPNRGKLLYDAHLDGVKRLGGEARRVLNKWSNEIRPRKPAAFKVGFGVVALEAYNRHLEKVVTSPLRTGFLKGEPSDGPEEIDWDGEWLRLSGS